MINWPVNFIVSKYSRCYERLIKKAQVRGTIQGYKERHHIIPRCFGGDNSKTNVVQLTAREHYIAHLLLWKMKFEGVYGQKMAFAFNTFISKMTTKERGVHHTYKISSRMYEIFREHYSQMLKDKYAKEGGTWVGRKHTEESKRLIGEKSKLKEFKRGPDHPRWGKKLNLSSETIEKKRNSTKAMWEDPERRAAMLKARETANQRPEVIANRKAAAEAKKGVKKDPAIIEKMAASKRGKTWEELYTEEQIARLREGRKNRVLSDEAKARMCFKGKGKGIPKVKKPCPHCGKMCAGNMLAKWHGDNCKTLKNR